MQDQLFEDRLAAQRGGQMQRSHAVLVARIQRYADPDQTRNDLSPAQPYRQRQRWIARRCCGERIGAAIEQVQREFFQSPISAVGGDAGGEKARKATRAGRRYAVAQQCLDRGRGAWAFRQPREHRRIAGAVSGFGIGAVAE